MTPDRIRRINWIAAVVTALAVVAAGAATLAERPGGSGEHAPRPLAVHDAPRPIEPITFAGEDGQRLSLADFRGQVVVLNIWATWCPPCREEMPTLDALQARLAGDDFQVVALSVDQTGAQVVREFYDETGIEHLNLYVDSTMQAMAQLRIRGVPTTLVLDRAGREIARITGKADWSAPPMVSYFRDLIDNDGAGTTAANGRGASG